jgi:hypothetical protein
VPTRRPISKGRGRVGNDVTWPTVLPLVRRVDRCSYLNVWPQEAIALYNSCLDTGHVTSVYTGIFRRS